MTFAKRALVLGATGGIGGETAAALLRQGWQVVAMTRDPDARRAPEGGDPLAAATWIGGDALNAADVRRAAEGVSVIVHAVNPPGDRDWGRRVLSMIDNAIAAAQAQGARIVLPGNIANYGPDAFPVLRENSPQHPHTQKGRIRVELERRLDLASHRAPALIVRFGDFFGPAPGASWFSQVMVTPGARLRAIVNPGEIRVGHSWAYLPDAAETFARLLDRERELEPFARFHFAGHWDPNGVWMIRAIAEMLGRPEMKVNALPWRRIGLAGLFSRRARDLHEMRYLWRTPARLDNSRLTAFLGKEPHTDLSRAVGETLKALNIS
jgi:nucleoside-diphosphate-sugar epimerase